MHSKEDVTQRDPLAMISYGIGVLPLIRDLRRDHPYVTQPWYADDAGAGGSFEAVMSDFRDLRLKGTAQGYFPEPTKSILVVAEQNVPRADSFSWRSLKWAITASKLPPAPASSAYHGCVTWGWSLLRSLMRGRTPMP